MGTDHLQIERLRRELLAASRQLERLAGDDGQVGVDPAVECRIVTARAWRRAHAARRSAFPEGASLFVDPAWEMLLDLYIGEHEQRPISVSSLCAASVVPHKTALRWLDRLIADGLARRVPDRADPSRSHVALTDESRACVEAALDAAVESDRRSGLARLRSG